MRFTIEQGDTTRDVVVDKVTARFGSAPDCDVVLDDPAVAPLHGELVLRRSMGTIRGSLTAHAPVLINGEPFTNQQVYELDRLRFGTTRVVMLRLDEPSGMRIVDDTPRTPGRTYNPPMPVAFLRELGKRPERELVLNATGTDEDALLWAIANAPADEATRAVYADLLIERGHESAAACVRGTNRDAGDPRWRAIVASGPIESCSDNRCPRDWRRLRAVRVDGAVDLRERVCEVCDDHVHYCTDGESEEWASRGQYRRVLDPSLKP